MGFPLQRNRPKYNDKCFFLGPANVIVDIKTLICQQRLDLDIGRYTSKVFRF